MEPGREDSPRWLSDRELVLAFQAGERAAYDEMFNRYRKRVYGVCTRILRNPQDAEEATQETFLRAYQALGRFNGRYQLGAWLARIASNASVDQLRIKARSPVVGMPDEQERLVDETNPEEMIAGSDPRLEEAIANVKPLHSRALAWRAVEGLSHQEIADRLSMSPKQVKALLHRARVSMRKAFDRAEGWALAPLFAFRSWFGDRDHGHTSSSLISATPTISPLLAERVTATALVVAVALSGFPTVSVTPTGPGRTRPVTKGSSAIEIRPGRVHMEIESGSSAVQAVAAAPTETVGDLARHIEGVLKGHDHLAQDRPKGGGNDDSPSTGNATSTARTLLKKVKELLPGGNEVVTPPSNLSL